MTPSEKKFAFIIFVLLSIVLGLLAYLWYQDGEWGRQKEKKVEIDFLNIGQGDASLITFPTGQQMLVDCGKNSRILSALGRHLPFYDRTIDILLVTHPDLDHYGGCLDVLQRYQVQEIIVNGLTKPNETYWKEWNTGVTEEQATIEIVHRPRQRIIGEVTLDFLYPDHEIEKDPCPTKEEKNCEDNNTSIIFQLRFASSSVLFTGDAEKELEKHLVETAEVPLSSTILKVGHHGSPSSSDEPFIKVVRPQYAVIQVGKNNPYGHPNLRVVRRLERMGASIFRNDIHGDITFHIREDGIESETQF